MRTYYVYIMSSYRRVLYVGVTNDLERRVQEHKSGATCGFTSKYNARRLVYSESTGDVWSALRREKQIKGWLRAKKIALIESVNPGWEDLAAEWLVNDTLVDRIPAHRVSLNHTLAAQPTKSCHPERSEGSVRTLTPRGQILRSAQDDIAAIRDDATAVQDDTKVSSEYRAAIHGGTPAIGGRL